MPKYIVTIDLKASFLWDHRAKVWIGWKTKELLKARYSLEAVVVREEPRGNLLSVSEMKELDNKGKGRSVLMYIYKKRM